MAAFRKHPWQVVVIAVAAFPFVLFWALLANAVGVALGWWPKGPIY